MVLLISKIRELESNYNVVRNERDHLTLQLESLKSRPTPTQVNTQTSSDASMVILGDELESTRQQLAEATRQVQSLASSVKELEKVSAKNCFVSY